MKVSCHCGAVELDIDLAKSDPIEDARRCDCSFCARRQAANITVPQDALSVVKGADHLSMYQWGTNRAELASARFAGSTRITAATATPASSA